MEKLVLTESIDLFCIRAKSFPEGIKDAFDTLSNLLTDSSSERIFYGISYPDEKGSIVYKAAVEQKAEEDLDKAELEKFTIPSGIYLTEKIEDFMHNIPAIGDCFMRLLANPEIDRFPCIEWYNNSKDVICLVKLKD
ncbi:hypothetical protein [Desertivirga arenae]|uniref:hypothetical protein n=1 Tax=Desertivirga arenae TaxID=2810309 RepID=UPI001A969B18|nr:hypothetical protein [Pedobacter sp. SYSU D00823]